MYLELAAERCRPVFCRQEGVLQLGTAQLLCGQLLLEAGAGLLQRMHLLLNRLAGSAGIRCCGDFCGPARAICRVVLYN